LLFWDLRSPDRSQPSNRPGGNEPYEPVILHARITIGRMNGPSGRRPLKGWAFHDWLQAEQESGKAEFATRKRPFAKEGEDADARHPFSISLWWLGLAVIQGFCSTFRTDWRLIVGQGKRFA